MAQNLCEWNIMSELEDKVKAKVVRRKVRVSMPISLDAPAPAPAPQPQVVFPAAEKTEEPEKKKAEPVKSGEPSQVHYHIYNMVRGVAGGGGRVARKKGKARRRRQKK